LNAGYQAVYDADLKGYFDSIPHDQLQACLRMRIADRQVLKLIRMWLQTPVVEEPEEKGGAPKVSRPTKGTPQGGVISPLLANLYLHGFDQVFHGLRGPARWANAKLVRYADDFVVLARFLTPNLRGWIEAKLETWMGLEINREKTRGVDLKEQSAHLDFLGYTFRYDRGWKGQGRGLRYLNIVPSKKALQREQHRLREMTGYSQSHQPLPRLIGELNRHLKGWGNYFSFGRPGGAYGQINHFVLCRLYRHVGRRSQRPFRPPPGKTHTQHFLRMGLPLLTVPR
jgi:RNA-directed DNA polymerase